MSRCSIRFAGLVLSGAICSSAHGAGGVNPLPQCSSLPAGSVQYAEASRTDTDARNWRPLFDGQSTRGWRGYESAAGPAAWSVKDGVLTVAKSRDSESQAGRGDIVTVDEFENFVLRLQWAATPAGNSGIFYLASLDLADRIWKVSPEMQILDDERSDDGQLPSHRAGALYDLYEPKCNALRPVGEYNDVRVVVRGGRVEHWLNGYLVVSYRLGTPQWREQVARSKFRDYPQFGAARRGHIALQDHGDEIRFREIHIRVLPRDEPAPR